MKITDFKEGDLICRRRKPKQYVPDPDYIGACFMFSEIVQGVISLMMLYWEPNPDYYNGRIFELKMEEYDDDFWDFYKSPKLRRPEIIGSLNKRRLDAINKGDELSAKLYESIISIL